MRPERIANPERPNCWMCGRVREVVMIRRLIGEPNWAPDQQYPIRICNICDRGMA